MRVGEGKRKAGSDANLTKPAISGDLRQRRSWNHDNFPARIEVPEKQNGHDENGIQLQHERRDNRHANMISKTPKENKKRKEEETAAARSSGRRKADRRASRSIIGRGVI